MEAFVEGTEQQRKKKGDVHNQRFLQCSVQSRHKKGLKQSKETFRNNVMNSCHASVIAIQSEIHIYDPLFALK